VVLETIDRAQWEGEDAPVVLHNPRLFRPFELITGMLPLPRYGTIDPTPYVGVFFPMFFGLMLGDAGYGAVVALLALVLHRRSAPGSTLRAVAEVAGPCALFAIVFGGVFGEFFGDLGKRWFGLEPLWLDRGESIVPFLVLTLALGLVHVILGLVLGVIAGARRDPRHAIGRGLSALMIGLIAVAILGALEVLPHAVLTPAVVALIAFPILILEGIVAAVELLSAIGQCRPTRVSRHFGTASVMPQSWPTGWPEPWAAPWSAPCSRCCSTWRIRSGSSAPRSTPCGCTTSSSSAPSTARAARRTSRSAIGPLGPPGPPRPRSNAMSILWVTLSAALAIGIPALATAWAQSRIGPAAAASLAEKPQLSTTVIILLAIPETMVILGFVVPVLILLRARPAEAAGARGALRDAGPRRPTRIAALLAGARRCREFRRRPGGESACRRATALAAREAELRAVSARTLEAGRREAKRQVLEARAEVLERIRRRAETLLAQRAADPALLVAQARYLERALDYLGTAPAVVEAPTQLLAGLRAMLDGRARVVAQPPTAARPGLLVRADDGALTVDATPAVARARGPASPSSSPDG
jgi:F0F1-type ATP synthase membrane subunit c/vacuolar-type H+-ATPase subunit K